MKQFAIIGLGKFGRSMLDELAESGCEILIIDRDRDAIDRCKDKATTSYVADAISEEVIGKLVPRGIDAAVVDMGDNLEVSILVTNYLKKIGVGRIITRAESSAHEEILDLVGATDVILPDREAARELAPLLLSSVLFRYMPLSKEFAIAEAEVPESLVGKTLIEAELRKRHELNVIALRKPEHEEEYTYFAPDYRIQKGDVLLIAGAPLRIAELARIHLPSERPGEKTALSRFFSRFRKKDRG